MIAGPGNRYVTEAKRQVAGTVGIDGIAGPSELVIVADGSAAPNALALDLCAQAEHGSDSPLALISPDAALLDRVAELVEELAASRPSVADAPLALITAPGLERALGLADALAPEHLELAFEGADEASARSRVAGCVFVGSGGRDRVRRLRRGLQPRPADGRRGALRRPARAGRIHAPQLDRLHWLFGGARIGAPRRRASPPPRAFRCTASRRARG